MTIVTGNQILAADVLAAVRQFTELAGTNTTTVTAAEGWKDWDLSAIVPAGTKCVLLSGGGGTDSVAFRKNGEAYERIYIYGMAPVLTEVDAGRIVEIKTSTVGAVTIRLLGYWKALA